MKISQPVVVFLFLLATLSPAQDQNTWLNAIRKSDSPALSRLGTPPQALGAALEKEWPTLSASSKGIALPHFFRADTQRAQRTIAAKFRTDPEDWQSSVAGFLRGEPKAAPPAYALSLASLCRDETIQGELILAASSAGATPKDMKMVQGRLRGDDAKIAWEASMAKAKDPKQTAAFSKRLGKPNGDNANELADLFRHINSPTLVPALLPWFDNKTELGQAGFNPALGQYRVCDLAVRLLLDVGITVPGATKSQLRYDDSVVAAAKAIAQAK